MISHKLGRKPRKFDTRIPRASRMIDPYLPPAPITIDWSAGMPDNTGVFLNDSLGDCTCAAFYHARQVWSSGAMGLMITDPDVDALQLYEGACGYKPGDSSTDNGGVEQDVLAYLLNTGAPTSTGIHKILGYVEVDQRNFDDLKRVIADCGVAYIGIEVPQSVMDNAGDNTIPWDVGGNTNIVGGHAVILVGYDLDSFTCISWGKRYKITNAFLSANLDEAYGIIDQGWIEATGKTPLGMDLADLDTAMAALKDAQ
jgi:hypothetical protein